jgi:hypothetical protein
VTLIIFFQKQIEFSISVPHGRAAAAQRTLCRPLFLIFFNLVLPPDNNIFISLSVIAAPQQSRHIVNLQPCFHSEQKQFFLPGIIRPFPQDGQTPSASPSHLPDTAIEGICSDKNRLMPRRKSSGLSTSCCSHFVVVRMLMKSARAGILIMLSIRQQPFSAISRFCFSM